MYEPFFGFKRKPFSLTSDPSFLYLNDRSREALAGITYAISERKGLMVLTGDAGTGKSTMLARVLRYLPADIHTCNVISPTLTGSEFLEMILLDFGVASIPESKTRRLQKLRQLLARNREERKISVLIVDEAHKLSREVLEEIRLLGNFENPDEKLLQVLLAGQPELADMLNREDMRQFKQRIAVRLRLEPLPEDDVGPYIALRCREAGGPEPHPFTPEAVALVAKCSNGIPRLINSICDSALLLAFAEESKQVTEPHVRSIAEDLDLRAPLRAPVLAPAARARAVPAVISHAHTPQAEQRSVSAPREIAPFREIPSLNGESNGSNRPWWRWWGRRKAAKVSEE
jgi:general secretion pathway protein A